MFGQFKLIQVITYVSVALYIMRLVLYELVIKHANNLETMNTFKTITAIVLFLTLFGCNQRMDSNAMLDNAETRSEIFTTIAGNHGYMMEFLDVIQNNEHAMQMMQGNRAMMGQMMEGDGMQMMMNDSMMMRGMMQNMMQDGRLMSHMMQMMHQEGIMGEDCMHSSMEMMGNKGMDMNGM